MHTPSPSVRDLARQLLAASRSSGDPNVHEAAAVVERLRIPLTKLAGVEGFASLQRRALVLASADVPSLQSVQVGADGRLEGIEQLTAQTHTGATHAGDEAAVVIAAHLLELLVTFIGKTLTLKLVRQAWPETLLDERNSATEAD